MQNRGSTTTASVLVLLAAPAAGQLECTIQKLEVAGDSDGVCLGSAVAIDADTAVVASPNDTTVYRRSVDAWVVEALLPIGGYALDLAGDTLAIGNHFADGAATGTGAVWVYERAGTSWTQAAKVSAQDGELGDRFGVDVAARSDEVVVGAAYDETVHGVQAGSAYVYRRAATGWSEVQHLVPAGGTTDGQFGRAVELSSDWLVVGEPNGKAGPNAAVTGRILVYESGPSGWVPSATLLPSSGYVDEDFGHALSLDQSRLAVGTYTFDADQDPLAYVFARTPTGWVEEALFSFPTFGLHFEAGHVSLHEELLAVGEQDVHLFRLSNGWQPVGTVTTVADSNPFTGGTELWRNRLINGAPDVDVPPYDATGIARIHELALPVEAYCTGKPNSLGCVPSIAWTGSPSATDPTPFTIAAHDVLSGKAGILFFGLNGRAALPFANGILCAAPPLSRTTAQNAGGGPPPSDCSGVLSIDFNAVIQSGRFPALDPGRIVDAQWWSRDPDHPDGTGISLSNALEATICP